MEETKKVKLSDALKLLHQINQTERTTPEGAAIAMYISQIERVMIYGVNEYDSHIEKYLYEGR